MENTIKHGTVVVNDEVLLFLQQDKRREEAEARSDRRHLSKTDFAAVEITIYKGFDLDPTFSLVYNKILLEHLYAAIAKLSKPEQKLIKLYYFERWTMEEIGKEFGISKMAVSKRMQQLLFHMQDLMKSWGPAIFLKNFKFLVYKPSTTVLYSRGFFFGLL